MLFTLLHLTVLRQRSKTLYLTAASLEGSPLAEAPRATPLAEPWSYRCLLPPCLDYEHLCDRLKRPTTFRLARGGSSDSTTCSALLWPRQSQDPSLLHLLPTAQLLISLLFPPPPNVLPATPFSLLLRQRIAKPTRNRHVFYFTLLSSRSEHNIVKLLYSSKN